MITKEYMKAVLRGEKELLKMSDVRHINFPAYDEIGVKAIYAKAIKMKGMAQYFPDKYPKGMQCDKSYFYNVWNTHHPDDVKEVISYANSQRYSVTSQKVRDESILITETW